MRSSDLSFVIQGPVYKEYKTESLIDEINTIFPKSQIILSTWHGEEISKFRRSVTHIIQSADPGAIIAIDSSKSPNNVNRQIVSTLEGLKKVSTPFVVKLRSDMSIQNDSILGKLSCLPKKSNYSNYDVTREYVLVSDVTSINPNLNLVLPHHPCDWLYAGLTSDLLDIWDIPLMPEDWFRYFEKNSWPTKGWYETNYLSRYRAESYIWWSFLKKYFEFEFENCFDINHGNLEYSEKIFGSNLVIVGLPKLGVSSRKHKIGNLTLRSCYTYLESVRLIKKQGRNIKTEYHDYLHHGWIKFLRVLSPLINPVLMGYYRTLEIIPKSVKKYVKCFICFE